MRTTLPSSMVNTCTQSLSKSRSVGRTAQTAWPSETTMLLSAINSRASNCKASIASLSLEKNRLQIEQSGNILVAKFLIALHDQLLVFLRVHDRLLPAFDRINKSSPLPP